MAKPHLEQETNDAIYLAKTSKDILFFSFLFFSLSLSLALSLQKKFGPIQSSFIKCCNHVEKYHKRLSDACSFAQSKKNPFGHFSHEPC
ncbi:hypothetical protein BD408DRAFT_422662 [Parasitella parasitica]|nr:hypothetical protein BD408DRAFT_422662 [Parasitella parasitica]